MTFKVNLIVENSSAGYNITAGSGVTLVGTFTYLTNKVFNLLVRVTNAGSGTEAVTIYRIN